MPKIAVVDFPFNYPPKGGSTVDLIGVLNHLKKQDFEIKLFVPAIKYRGKVRHYWNVGDFVIDQENLGLDVEVLPFPLMKFNYISLPVTLHKRVAEYKPDYVFLGDGFFMKPHLVNTFKDFRVILRFYAYELFCPNYIVFYNRFKNFNCRFSSIEDPLQCYICTTRSLAGIHKPDIYQWDYFMSLAFVPFYYQRLLKKALKNSYRIIVYNELIKNIIKPFNERTYIIPSGLNPDEYNVKSRFDKEVKIIFASGRFDDPMKGLNILLDAVRLLRVRRNDFKLVVTSDVDFKEDYIESTGWLEPKGIREKLRESDIYVLPSIWREPLGIGAIEAMACGVPVIASDGPGTGQIIDENETGFLVPSENPEALADRIGNLLDDTNLRKKFGKAGRKRAEEHFAWERIIDKHYLKDIFV